MHVVLAKADAPRCEWAFASIAEAVSHMQGLVGVQTGSVTVWHNCVSHQSLSESQLKRLACNFEDALPEGSRVTLTVRISPQRCRLSFLSALLLISTLPCSGLELLSPWLTRLLQSWRTIIRQPCGHRDQPAAGAGGL